MFYNLYKVEMNIKRNTKTNRKTKTNRNRNNKTCFQKV